MTKLLRETVVKSDLNHSDPVRSAGNHERSQVRESDWHRPQAVSVSSELEKIDTALNRRIQSLLKKKILKQTLADDLSRESHRSVSKIAEIDKELAAIERKIGTGRSRR